MTTTPHPVERDPEEIASGDSVGTRAVLLAGGKGTRLAPFTSVLPKPLMPLGEEPILSLLLQQLAQHGVREVTLAVGHLADLIKTYCGDGERFGLNVTYLHEETPLGTVGPLAQVPDLDDTFLVMNGDLLTTLDYRELVDSHRSSGAKLTLSVTEREIQFEFGVLDVERQSGTGGCEITAMHEKPTFRRWVSMGAYVFEPEVLEYIEPGKRLDLPDLVQTLLASGDHVGAFEFDGYWLDIGRHSDYQKALEDFERNSSRFRRSQTAKGLA